MIIVKYTHPPGYKSEAVLVQHTLNCCMHLNGLWPECRKVGDVSTKHHGVQLKIKSVLDSCDYGEDDAEMEDDCCHTADNSNMMSHRTDDGTAMQVSHTCVSSLTACKAVAGG